MMPKRIQMTRQRPWRAENPDAVIVARPSRWGNPFRVMGGTVYGQRWHNVRANWGLGVIRLDEYPYSTHGPASGAVAAAVDKFRTLCEVERREHPRKYGEWIEPLRGKDLACRCPLDQPCHADVLLEIANGGD